MKDDAIMKCDYCNRDAELKSGKEVYPHRADLHHKWIWVCEPCDARCGCHGASQKPLGRMANAELRRARMEAHAAFDPLWKKGNLSRTEAYAWLANQLGLAVSKCHIGLFGIEMCYSVRKACDEG